MGRRMKLDTSKMYSYAIQSEKKSVLLTTVYAQNLLVIIDRKVELNILGTGSNLSNRVQVMGLTEIWLKFCHLCYTKSQPTSGVSNIWPMGQTQRTEPLHPAQQYFCGLPEVH